MDARHGNGRSILLTQEQDHIVSLWQETPNQNSRGAVLGHWMRTKNSERVPVVTLDELFELIKRQI
jgi:hypothetical protein